MRGHGPPHPSGNAGSEAALELSLRVGRAASVWPGARRAGKWAASGQGVRGDFPTGQDGGRERFLH